MTTGAYLAKIREYEAEETAPEFATLRKTLVDMAAQYEQACAIVHGHDTSYVDFHARRLVEMAGHIIMGWLLVLDAQRCSDFTKSARVFIGNHGLAACVGRSEMLRLYQVGPRLYRQGQGLEPGEV